MIRRLTAYQDATGVRVVAVFDGTGAKMNEATEPGGIQIFYSGAGQTADEIVERLVAKYASQHEITVATSDLMEQQTATTFGALVVSAEGLRPWLAEAQADLAREIKKLKRRL